MPSTDTSMNANAFASTFYFFSTHKATAEKNKKSLQANAPDSADIANLTHHKLGRKEARTDNMGYTTMRGAVLRMTVLCKVEHLCFVLKFSGKSPALRVAQNRYAALRNAFIRAMDKRKFPATFYPIHLVH